MNAQSQTKLPRQRLGRSNAVASLLLVAALLCMQPALAVRLDTVYSTEVDLPSGSNGMTRAFNAALSRVLVKASGLSTLGSAAARRSLVPDSASLVQQYSRLPDNRLRVEFDGVALRRLLDQAGQPVWGVERPLVAIWYAVDSGNGQRQIISGEAEPGRRGRGGSQDLLRKQLSAAAEERGLPVILPLVDAQDMAGVSFSDVWGDFRDPVMAASRRYGADAVLIGRARSMSGNNARVRWTLATRTEHVAWEGSVAAGPVRAAEHLSQQLATYADTSGALRLVITDVANLDVFGQLSAYFRSLNIVQNATVAAVRGDRVEFELQVRGGKSRLQRALAGNPRLSQVAAPDAAPTATQAIGRRPDLTYRWTGGASVTP